MMTVLVVSALFRLVAGLSPSWIVGIAVVSRARLLLLLCGRSASLSFLRNAGERSADRKLLLRRTGSLSRLRLVGRLLGEWAGLEGETDF